MSTNGNFLSTNSLGLDLFSSPIAECVISLSAKARRAVGNLLSFERTAGAGLEGPFRRGQYSSRGPPDVSFSTIDGSTRLARAAGRSHVGVCAKALL